MSIEVEVQRQIPRATVVAWGLWDWGCAAFNAVVLTFVFSVYLTSGGFGSESEVTASLGWALTIAGVLVALVAPVLGQRSDGNGRRKLWLAIFTALLVVTMALLFFVRPEPGLLFLGLLLLAVGTILYEFATVNYNAMLAQVSTSATIGKVSGFGWGMGYLGGIVLLLIVYFGFISPDVGLFGVTSEDGLAVRVTMIVAAVWFAVFAIPVFLAVPELPVKPDREQHPGIIGSYRELGRSVAALWRESRQTVFFLFASAVFRDGLNGVFAFGGVLAATVFGFSAGQVIIFAIAANVVAGIATIAVGALDDRIGPKPVIVWSLIGLVITGTAMFILNGGGQTVFWVTGLALCIFVGPAQSASRTYLARMIPPGREGEMFGLYATTGRAASFLAPAAWALAITLGGSPEFGIIGVVAVLLAGLLLLIPVRAPKLANRVVETA